MTPKRPYLVRALYEWLLDNELTPHVVIDANWPGTEVPAEYVQDGQIVLNIHPDATTGLQMAEVDMQFQARFGGVPRRITVPYGALLAIYARENGAGSIFEPEPAYEDPEAAFIPEEPNPADLKPVETPEGTPENEGDSAGKSARSRGRPHLKVIK
ncbi:ClpXP protease specificity-enhancing factor [Aliidiomarina taiwanensis]|uniref:ClpXP protease specificity-enhancing factor n=2 Tax=Aliidiomarina taiwanensis TaxID=946228 RepID=A0A432X7M5_9GAMM|nr:ClpXP protease specificity-enhancing factor [Aliidiomarina taiwanensis]RUO42874.1 ClpXP protease specificity-enhancing factor [Aliidiomarina taiwanensis]